MLSFEARCSIRVSYAPNLGNGEASVLARRSPAVFIKH